MVNLESWKSLYLLSDRLASSCVMGPKLRAYLKLFDTKAVMFEGPHDAKRHSRTAVRLIVAVFPAEEDAYYVTCGHIEINLIAV